MVIIIENSLPKGFTTDNYYRGVNILLLWGSAIDQKFAFDEWAGYWQWHSKKGCAQR
jgi:antirestriction protein ArdC